MKLMIPLASWPSKQPKQDTRQTLTSSTTLDHKLLRRDLANVCIIGGFELTYQSTLTALVLG